jgi:hypothetical protein
MRIRVGVLRLFDDVELIPPGVVNVSSWRASLLAGKSAPDNILRGLRLETARKTGEQ